MGNTKPWRRDAWRWAIKYGAIAAILVFGYLRLAHHSPALEIQPSLSRDGPTALGWGVFTAIVFLVVRWRGSLVDLDELNEVGRGGLGLGQPRRRPNRDEPDSPKDPPESPEGS